MKTLPGLPVLPTGHWWEVRPSTGGDYFFVELKANTPRSILGIPSTLGVARTRCWPRPTVRSIVRVAHAVHRRWVAEEARKSAPFVGKLVGR